MRNRLLTKYRLFPLIPFVLSILLNSPSSFSQSGRFFQPVKLSEKVYLALATDSNQEIGNCGFVITSQWVCVYGSSQRVEAAEELIALIKNTTPLPIRYLVNSQYRGHHTHGNQSFLSSHIVIISSRQARSDMVDKDLPQLQRYQQVLPDSIDRLKKEIRTTPAGPQADELLQEIARREKIMLQLSSLRLVLPDLSFDSSLSMHDGEQELIIMNPGKGSTAGDVILWLADQKILYAGDLVFTQMIPDLDDAYTKEWIDTLSVMEKMKPEVVVPAIGPVSDENILLETRQYLTELRKTVKQYFDKGDGLDLILQNCVLPNKYKTYKDTDYYPNNIEKVYRELQAEASVQVKPPPTLRPE